LTNGGAITWGSKRQTTIALSSMEAEYVALSEAAREAIWLDCPWVGPGRTSSVFADPGPGQLCLALAWGQQWPRSMRSGPVRSRVDPGPTLPKTLISKEQILILF
jgi:hypothetical protein